MNNFTNMNKTDLEDVLLQDHEKKLWELMEKNQLGIYRDNELMLRFLSLIEGQEEFVTEISGTYQVCEQDKDYVRVTNRGFLPIESPIDNYVVLERTDDLGPDIKVSISIEYLPKRCLK